MTADRRHMRLMLIILFTLYAAMQLFAVARAGDALALTRTVITVLLAWVTLMTVAPLLLWRWEQHGWHRPVLVGAWIGYSWMGMVFLFFWVALALDLVGAALRLAGAARPISAAAGFWLATAATGLVFLYGFVAAHRLHIERVALVMPKLPAGSAPLRIALIADVHLGALVGVRRLRAILAVLRELDPDVLVSAGDLVDGQADRLNGMAPMIAGLKPRYGKFAVTGNHEYFAGLERALAFHARAGFTMLRGTAVAIADSFCIAGVDDPAGISLGLPANTDEHGLHEQCGRDRIAILVKHQPRVDQPASGGFDLQLSGHVHKGQIFPFGLLVRLAYPVATGLSRAGSGWLYVSRGTGTWGPPLRVLAPPEITLIELRAAK